MPNADETTVKIPAYSGKAERIVPQNTLTEAQNVALELVNKSRQLEDEKKKAAEYLKTIERLTESLKQEQAKAVEIARKLGELEARAKDIAVLEAKAKRLAELESKVKELTEVLDRISGVPAAGKTD
jgi:uncharacterized protein (DUF3084 family)